MLSKLQKQISYGYLPKNIKATVNEIIVQLSQEPAIEELYNEWNKINREKLSLYYENKDPTVPLADNKEFRSIKNMIIKAVSEMAETAELVATVQQKDKTNSETVQIRLHVSEGTTAAEPPVSADPPPIVIHYEESVPKVITITAREIIGALARLIGDKCMAHRQSLQEQIDHRLKQEINEKKLAMGLKTERTQKASYQTEETYEMSM